MSHPDTHVRNRDLPPIPGPLPVEIRERIFSLLRRYPSKQAVTLPALHLVQDKLRCVPRWAVEEIADILDLSPAEVHDTMSFYGFFRDESDRLGARRLWVCRSLACALRGADSLLEKASEFLGVPVGGTTSDGTVTLELAECLGACEGAPACMIDDEHVHDISDESRMRELVHRLRNAPAGPASGQ
ncbi:MAG: NAD(P)H-dependent oxidoreductase subunit E [Planctomycetes bacterium]|nr:NAD(P)H-dependent oxidoreductase subunit E [Planctomycetota bacterium]